jgi:hypothetical protein
MVLPVHRLRPGAAPLHVSRWRAESDWRRGVEVEI